MMNDEMAGRGPKSTLKPHQCENKATSKPVDSQLIGTPLGPQGSTKATPMRPQSHPEAKVEGRMQNAEWLRKAAQSRHLNVREGIWQTLRPVPIGYHPAQASTTLRIAASFCSKDSTI